VTTPSLRLRPLPGLPRDAHKGDAGRCLCVVGSAGMPGAAILVARAAQRAGAGLVVVGCLDPGLFTVIPPAAPEAVLLDLSAAFACEGRAAPGAGELLSRRVPHALLVGPGIGDDARARALVPVFLGVRAGAPRVLDADALNALDGEPERLREACGPTVVTPHPGEAARLAGREVPRDDEGRVAFALELAARTGAIVCLKGAGTVVADAEHATVNRTGNPGMATAGSGDVLAGILVAYLARAGGDFTPFDAAALAVHVHGVAGDLAAARLGERAVVASDLIACLPDAQRVVEEATKADGG